jgi:Putative Ig domain.
MANGKPLPNWLLFNPTHLTFSGTPPEGETNILDLVVTARNSSGREASVNFSLNLNSNPVNGAEDQNLPNDEAVQPDAMPQTQGEQIRLNGEEIAAPGLSAQLDCNGQSGLLKAAQEFLRSIQML